MCHYITKLLFFFASYKFNSWNSNHLTVLKWSHNFHIHKRQVDKAYSVLVCVCMSVLSSFFRCSIQQLYLSICHGGRLSSCVSPLCHVSVFLSSCPDEAHEAAPASPGQCGAAAAPRALQKAHMANTNTRQSQAHRGGYHRLCGEYDAAGSTGHVQQDRQSRCSPSPAKPSSNEAWVGHSPCAGKVSLYWTRESQG